MLTATAFLADGLDLVVEFLARSEAGADAVCARYASREACRDAAATLARWSAGLPGAEAIRSDACGVSLSMPMALWQGLYVRALHGGLPTPPDRIGLRSLGAGGMPASLALVLDRAERACRQAPAPWSSHPELESLRALPGWQHVAPEALQVLEWEPLRELLWRDALLRPDVQGMRRLAQPPQMLTDELLAAGFVLEGAGRPALLVCRPDWRAARLDMLSAHFLEHLLLLFRLLCPDPDSGWGLDADSRMLAGFAELLAHGQDIGFVHAGDFGAACAAMAALQERRPAPDGRAALHNAVVAMTGIWPETMLGPGTSLAPLFAGWMVRIHPGARIDAQALIEPAVNVRAGVVIEAGAVLRAGCRIGAHARVPAGVVIAAGARVTRIKLDGVTLPQGTLLRGDLRVRQGAWIQRHVEFGQDVDIGPGVTVRDGLRVGDRARITCLRMGERTVLARGTRVAGNLDIACDVRIGPGVCLGRDVRIGAGASIGAGIVLPAHTVVNDVAHIDILDCGVGAHFEPGVVLCGDAVIGAGAIVGAGVVLGADAWIGPGVALPPGVEVDPGARIHTLQLPDNLLPRGSRLGGNLALGRRCDIGRNIRFGADVRIAAGVSLPDGVVIAPGAQIDALQLRRTHLPAGTALEGNLRLGRGVRVGRNVRFGAGARIAAGVVLPDGVVVGAGAQIDSLHIPAGALPFGAVLHGALHLHDGAVVGRGAVFHADVHIACACAIPDGLEFARGAVVHRFELAPEVRLPAGTVVSGDLRIEADVTVGEGVRFGPNVIVGPGVAIPTGAELAPDARVRRLTIGAHALLPAHFVLGGDLAIGMAARIGEAAVLGADCTIGHGVHVPPGVHIAPGARVERLRIAAEVALPPGTTIAGDLEVAPGALIHAGVTFGADVRIAPHVVVPGGAVILPGARIRQLLVPADALPPGTMLAGDLKVGAGARIGDTVRFGAGVSVGAGACIAAGLALPDGLRVLPCAQVDVLEIAADARWPALAWIGGDIEVGAAATIGEEVRFGAGVRVGAGAVIGAGARIGEGAVIAAGAVVERGRIVPAGAYWDPAASSCPGEAASMQAPAHDAPVEAWAAHLGRAAVMLPSDDTAASAAPAPVRANTPSEPLAIAPRSPRVSPWRI